MPSTFLDNGIFKNIMIISLLSYLKFDILSLHLFSPTNSEAILLLALARSSPVDDIIMLIPRAPLLQQHGRRSRMIKCPCLEIGRSASDTTLYPSEGKPPIHLSARSTIPRHCSLLYRTKRWSKNNACRVYLDAAVGELAILGAKPCVRCTTMQSV